MKDGFSCKTDLDKVIRRYIQKIEKQISGIDSIEAGIINENATTEDETKIKDIAVWNEYGTDNIPARPFLRTTLKEKFSLWFRQMIRLLQKGKSIKTIAEDFALWMQADLIKKIDSNMAPANRESTLKAYARWHTESKNKKEKQKIVAGKKTLIWSGRMRNEIKYRIRKRRDS